MGLHRSYELGTSRHRDGRIEPYVTLYTQPLWRQIIAEAYHLYDMKIVMKIPGLHRLEHWLYNRNTDLTSMPMCARRDLRCDQLTHAGRTHLHTFTIDADTYVALGGEREHTQRSKAR